MRNGQTLLCDAADGMFTLNGCEGYSSVEYNAAAVKKFSFIFAILRQKTWQLWLRAVVTKSHGLQLFNLEHQFGPIILPPEFQLNTAAVFGIVPSAENVKIDFVVHANAGGDNDLGYTESVEWPYPSNKLYPLFELQCEDNLDCFDGPKKFNRQLDNNKRVVKVQLEPNNDQNSTPMPCFNCGKLHFDVDCEFPEYFIRCPRCFIVSFSNTGHRVPCSPVNTATAFRANILGKITERMFQLRVKKADADLLVLEDEDFRMVHGSLKLLSSPTCGVFTHEELANEHVMSYEGNAFTRFTFLIAIFHDKKWRLRYRGIVSPIHGLLLLKLKKTMEFEGIYSSKLNNTAAVYGLKPKNNAMNVDFRIFATNNGHHLQNFNGYTGSIQWRCSDGHFDQSTVDDVIDGKTPKTKKLFHHTLYDSNWNYLSFSQQVFDLNAGFVYE